MNARIAWAAKIAWHTRVNDVKGDWISIMHIERILVVEDDAQMSKLIDEILTPTHRTLQSVGSVAAARQALRSGDFDLVLCDVRLPDGNGIEILRESHAQRDPPLYLMMSGYATIESATEAMREGAVDYLVKPFSPDQLDVALQRAETWKRITVENALLRRDATVNEILLGESPAIQKVRRLIQQIGPTDATVLIHGESGTGKELVARALVEASPRLHQPFVRLNCAAIPENLMESELFGHERGSFTGAHSKRIGRFELAHGGTLLLDEISEIPLTLQAKLLRVLQEKEIERVGGSRTIAVNVRILATTNRDLKSAVERELFREDLFYRLNVVPIHLPPLRERPGDVDLLLEHCLKHFAVHHGKPLPQVSEEARQFLRGASWPGNVRELQNAVERAVLLATAGHPLGIADFGAMVPSAPSSASAAFPAADGEEDLSVSRMEQHLIRRALDQTGGNRTRAAKRLGISLRTLQYKLRREDQVSKPSVRPASA